VNDLVNFGLIVPCGIDNVIMTSVFEERSRREDPEELWSHTRQLVVHHFARHLDRVPREPAGLEAVR
jgi:lipoate-protein ligase B